MNGSGRDFRLADVYGDVAKECDRNSLPPIVQRLAAADQADGVGAAQIAQGDAGGFGAGGHAGEDVVDRLVGHAPEADDPAAVHRQQQGAGLAAANGEPVAHGLPGGRAKRDEPVVLGPLAADVQPTGLRVVVRRVEHGGLGAAQAAAEEDRQPGVVAPLAPSRHAQVMIAQHRIRHAAAHHLSHQSHHAGTVGATIDQVTHENQSAALRVIALSVVAQVCHERSQSIDLAMNVADDVQRPLRQGAAGPPAGVLLRTLALHASVRTDGIREGPGHGPPRSTVQTNLLISKWVA